MVANNLIPDIRFDGFEEEWEKNKLGKLGYTFTGLSGKTKEDFGHGQGRFVTYMNVFSNPISNLGQLEPIEIDNSQHLVQTGDVFFTTSSETPQEVGMSSVWLGKEENVYLNSFCFGFRPISNLDHYYLAYMLRSPSFRKEITFLAQGISRYNISKNKVLEISVLSPSLEEQTQIGNYLKELDILILSQEQKLEKVKNLKKAMLEKMFPKANADVPEIRFKGFTEKWEKKKLGLVSSIGDIDHRMPNSTLQGIPYLMTGDFVGINDLNFTDVKLVSNEDYEKLSKKIKPEFGDVLIARYASVGAVRYINFHKKFLISYSCAILKPDKSVSGEYIFFFLTAHDAQRQIEQDINAGSQRNIGIDALKKLVISLPSIREQQKIGEYFRNLDKLIDQSQQKIKQLKNLKEALLQKMFI